MKPALFRSIVLCLFFISQCDVVRSQCTDPDLGCSCQGATFTCDSKGLLSIPIGIPDDTQRVELDTNNISEIKNESFTGLTDVFMINLNYNKITSISANAFADLVGLITLNLRGNLLTTLPATIFSNNADLQTVRLDDNHVESLPASVLVPSIMDIHFTNNPTKCCLMLDFVKKIVENSVTSVTLNCNDVSPSVRYDSFNESYCIPVDGQWGEWVNSSCTVTCGNGTYTRTRSCDSPSPSNGGNTCTGTSTDIQSCYLDICKEAESGLTTNDNEMMPLIAGVVVGVCAAAGAIALVTIVLVKKTAAKVANVSNMDSINTDKNDKIWS